jgi:hypothetical protein
MNDRYPTSIRFAVMAGALTVSACVSDALPRDPPPEAGVDASDASTVDAARDDGRDGALGRDVGGFADGSDAGNDRAVDAVADVGPMDVDDATDTRVPSDASDVSTDADASARDATADLGAGDADGGADAVDANTGDSADARAADVTDSGTVTDVRDASGIRDSRDGADAIDADADASGGDAGDAARDGGINVFFEENFDTFLGTFSSPLTVCGSNVPQWSNNAGYAHASEPAGTGISRVSSPIITVPANTSNIRLRMSHRYDIETGWDNAQLLVSINGAALTQVTAFIVGGYTNGGHTNPSNCALTGTQGQFPGWSGDQPEAISEVDLSAAPFNVGPDDTVRISFQMLTDNSQSGAGWDINWVTLSGTSP